MNRAQDIKEKLAYTLTKYKEIQAEISIAEERDTDVSFLGQKAGEIISGCRECMDYCAKDIADTYIVALSANSTLISKYNQGKLRAYFPFYINQLHNRNGLFYELRNTNSGIYSYLLDLAKRIRNDQLIPGTMIGYKVLLEINEMVNQKKHDKITTVHQKENSQTRVQFPGGGAVTVSPLFKINGDRPDFTQNVPPMEIVGSPGTNIKYVKEFRFDFNDWQLGRFCMHAIQGTNRLTNDIYSKFFQIQPGEFDPWENIKPEEQRKAEAALKSISPIAIRPMRVVLFFKGNEVINTQLSFGGDPVSKDRIDITIANLFLIAFEKSFYMNVQSQMNDFILNNWNKIDTNDNTPRYFEVSRPLDSSKKIFINDDKCIEFDRIFFSIGSKFNFNKNINKFQNIEQNTAYSAAAIINTNEKSFRVVTDDLGNILSCAIE